MNLNLTCSHLKSTLTKRNIGNVALQCANKTVKYAGKSGIIGE